MDYKYIEQLLERYFQCETTLKEEEILRAFFTQADVPVWLVKYRDLFCLQQCEEAPLDERFDERIMAMVDKDQTAVKARIVTMTRRLMPLFKAAAIVAIILTIGNAAQAPWYRGWDNPREEYAKFHQQKTDSINMLAPIQAENIPAQAETIMDSVQPLTTPPTY